MRITLAKMFGSISRWLSKGMPYALTGSQWSGTSFVDSFKRDREPTPNEMLAELKGTAWACASINAAACAANPPSLYVITKHNQPKPKCATRPVSKKTLIRLSNTPHLVVRLKSAANVEEVTEHPLLDLFQNPNPFMGLIDLWELTTLYQEILGQAYWYLDRSGFMGTPEAIWVLPAQNVTPRRADDSPGIVDYYQYRNGQKTQNISVDEIIHFRYPNPRNPYLEGLSPLRAAYEQQSIVSDYTAYKKAKFENSAIPDALISPNEVIGEEERDRLETQWNQRFRRGGSGKVVVADSALSIQLLSHSVGDVAAMAEMGATKEDIANAFHVPIAFWTSNTNMANLYASRFLHATMAINPRLKRRDETINSQLIPIFDPSGRLFVESPDATPVDPSVVVSQIEQDLKYGVRSINEVRSDNGLPPVPWGEAPWVPGAWAPMDQARTPEARGLAKGGGSEDQYGNEEGQQAAGK